MKVIVLTCLNLFILSVAAAPQEENVLETVDAEENHRDEKFFIAIVKIPRDTCTTGDPVYTEGICMPDYECTKTGGIASGTCAKGLGSCCVAIKTCNEETSVNNTYFVSPDGGCTGTCSLTVNRISSDICQLRLDFVNFNIAQPVNDGECRDKFFVQGGLNQYPVICGYNTGQHMYINVDPNGGPIKIMIHCDSTTVYNREWNIKISQISCHSRYRVPEDCLQYYTEISGNVWSFNYPRPPVQAAITQPPTTWQLQNQNYAVCVERAPGFCSITWERDPTDSFAFTISNLVSIIDPAIIDLGTYDLSDRGPITCFEDYVIIPEGSFSNGSGIYQADRYCGLGFPDSVTSEAAPFILRYRTNDAEFPLDDGNRGFSLIYHQNFCFQS